MSENNLISAYALRAEFWDAFFGDRTEEVDFWTALAKPYGSKILAPMCATGEIAFGLAQRGFRVTGVDRTPEMVGFANLRAAGEDRIAFIQADLRTLSLPETRFDFAFFGTGDFHHFLDPGDRVAVLARVAAHLRPGGSLAMELFNPPKDSKPASRSGGLFHPLRPPKDPNTSVWKTSETSYDPSSRTLEIAQKMFVQQTGTARDCEYRFKLQLFKRREIVDLLHKTGFTFAAAYGSYDRSAWNPQSSCWIIYAQKNRNSID